MYQLFTVYNGLKDQRFSEENAEMLECEYCESHICRACLKLSSTKYKLLGKTSDLHWYCLPCEEKAMKCVKIEKEIEEKMQRVH